MVPSRSMENFILPDVFEKCYLSFSTGEFPNLSFNFYILEKSFQIGALVECARKFCKTLYITKHFLNDFR